MREAPTLTSPVPLSLGSFYFHGARRTEGQQSQGCCWLRPDPPSAVELRCRYGKCVGTSRCVRWYVVRYDVACSELGVRLG